MFTSLADLITTRLCTSAVIEEEDADLYRYGFFILLTSIFHFVVTAILGLLFGVVWESILFYILFTLLRSYAGGVHAKTEQSCLLLTDIAMLLSVLGIRFLQSQPNTIFAITILAVGLICILALSPLDTNEKQLSREERQYYRVLSFQIATGILILALFSYAIGVKGIFYSAVMSFGLESTLLIVGKLSSHNLTSISQKP